MVKYYLGSLIFGLFALLIGAFVGVPTPHLFIVYLIGSISYGVDRVYEEVKKK